LLWHPHSNDEITADRSQVITQVGDGFDQKLGTVRSRFGKAKSGLPELAWVKTIEGNYYLLGVDCSPEWFVIVNP
jgi:hypothetical protein